MRKTAFIIFSIFSFTISLAAQAKYFKKQDADYVRQWCSQHKGTEQKVLKNGLRADCVTSLYAVEVDSVIAWEKNLDQALAYGKASGKKAKFVAVLEDPSQELYFKKAEQKIKGKNLPVEIERLENFKSKELSLKEIDGPIIKLSKSGNKCHVKGCGSYGQTKNFTPFNTLAECINAGGELPGNVGEGTLWSCEVEAAGKSSIADISKGNKSKPIADIADNATKSPPVKLSLSGNKCHKKGSRYYKQTKRFKVFSNMKDCLSYASGNSLALQ